MDLFTEEWFEANREDLIKLGEELEKHLSKKKVFVPSDNYIYALAGIKTAREIFTECKTEVRHDAWQTGGLVLIIKGKYFDTSECGVEKFQSIFKGASIFELSSLVDGDFQFEIVYNNALKRI